MLARFLGTVAVTGTLVSTAIAEPSSTASDTNRPQGTYVVIDESMASIRQADDPVPANGNGGLLLYLNRCEGGATFQPGFNDSRTNRSSIVNRTVSLPEYPYGEASWNEVVDCVRELFRPFDVQIVTEDPGPGVAHDEAVVCGHPRQINMEDGVGGVAPFACGIIDNAITFTFPETWGNSPRNICETIGQEAAHAWGLDHEYLCADPMTYLFNCGDKAFQDIDAPCGEYNERQCRCGGSRQNSFRRILSAWGPAERTPPEVTITKPKNNAQVKAGFPIHADVVDDDGVVSVAVEVDGIEVTSSTLAPWTFNAPDNIAEGGHEVVVKATDKLGTTGSAKVFVIVGEPCTRDTDCGDGDGCVDGRCVPVGNEGGLGDECAGGDECASNLCGEDGAGNKYCTVECDLEAGMCPAGVECQNAGAGGVCWPSEGGGGGCTLSRRDGASWAGLTLLALFLALRPRRRRSAP